MARNGEEVSITSDSEAIASDVPSIDDMISGATDGAPSEHETAMEEMHVIFSGADDDETETPVVVTGKRAYTKRGTATDKPRAKKKAEIQEENDALRAKVASLEARTDVDKIKTLAAGVSMASILGFGWTAQRRGMHWALNEQEAKELGETTAQALAPYADTINESLPAGMAVMTWVKVLSDRVAIDRERVRQLNASQ